MVDKLMIAEQINSFSKRYGKNILVGTTNWRYYCLGKGKPVIWLGGGIRRASIGYMFMEQLSRQYLVIAPDYSPVRKADDFFSAMDLILQTEGVKNFTLIGQSYGGYLAQAYLLYNGNNIDKLILSNSVPINAIGKNWITLMNFIVTLIRILPEKTVKKMIAIDLLKHITVPESQRVEWLKVINDMLQNDLSIEDAVSHFSVAIDVMRKGLNDLERYKNWTGQVSVIYSENDPTQRKKYFRLYEQLFDTKVKILNMGNLGHTAALFNPVEYVKLLEQIL